MQSLSQIRKEVQWKDLRHLTIRQIAFNIILPYPFLAFAWWGAWQDHIVLALGAWFLFFTGSFRQAHDGFHHTLGINKQTTDYLLWWSSGLLMTSNHAIRQTHLQHHRTPLQDSDIEARFYKLKWWQAILKGSWFWLTLQWYGIQLANKREKAKILADFGLMGVMIISAFTVHQLGFSVWLYHILIMCIANSFVGFVAGWCVHHDCSHGDEEIIARTERNPIINAITFNLLLHMEHHVFPNIPTNNLPELSRRLDKAAPEMMILRVTPNLNLDKLKPINKSGLYRKYNLYTNPRSKTHNVINR